MGERIKPGFCLHCGSECADRLGSEIYPSLPDLRDKVIWVCCLCENSRVGSHEEGPLKGKPLGSACNAEVRGGRVYVHTILDALWKYAYLDYPTSRTGLEADRKKALAIIRRTARVRVYAYLADYMGLSKEECHVALFDLEECRKAYRFLKQKTYADIRAWAKARKADHESKGEDS